jgi:RNA polymerase sigma-70 factor (ECF subfamily)
VVLAAGQGCGPESRNALEVLCRDYWYPLYVYVRRRGHDAETASDLVQEFFARVLEKNTIAAADPQRGRFRAFLLTALRNFLANEWASAGAAKRGKHQNLLSLDLEAGELRYLHEPADELTPERLFERRWAETLLDRVTARLREESVRSGKGAHFDALKIFLTGRTANASYAAVAGQLGLSEGAAMVAAHRLRKRFRETLLAEILETLADPADLGDEINRLFEALGP